MNERLLQFIWQFRYFNPTSLSTADGRSMQVIHPGNLNQNAGPDFHEAKIKIGNTVWVGNVELHVSASEWNQHNHSLDKNYDNIILHVVWVNDQLIHDKNNLPIPTLELQSLVPKIILQRYEQLMQTPDSIPCSFALPVLDNLSWISWKERLVAERLTQKSMQLFTLLKSNNNNWEEVFWVSLCRSFGMKVNATIFENLAKTIPLKILAVHKNQIHQLEALLLGQSGFLNDDFQDNYPVMLQKEYRFLAKKYNLQQVNISPVLLRMRPSNFPGLRLAQLAMLVHKSNHLFSKIKSVKTTNEIFQWFDIAPNDFWLYHFTLTDNTSFSPKALSKSFIEHVIINTVSPVFFAYGDYLNENTWKEKAVNFLLQLNPEQNNITKQWKAYGVSNKNAMDSQALIHLKNNYCKNKNCLHCAVGTKLLQQPGMK